MNRATKVLQAVRERLISINEDTVVKFDGKMYPESGWCVIMSGGSGSGKGYIRDNFLAINSKIFDDDKLKELWMEVKGLNSQVPANTSKAHQHVKEKGWKKATRDNFFNSINKDPSEKSDSETRSYYTSEVKNSSDEVVGYNIDVLPNVLFDITGDDLTKIQDIVQRVKRIGDYKVSLVWVVTSRERAIIQNILRPRRVPEQELHKIHTAVNKTMLGLILDQSIQNQYGKLIDEMWVVINSGVSAQRQRNRTNPKNKETYEPFSNKKSAEEYYSQLTKNIFQVKKIGEPFNTPKKNIVKIRRIIGSQDQEAYYSSDTILNRNLVSAAEKGSLRLQKHLNFQ